LGASRHPRRGIVPRHQALVADRLQIAGDDFADPGCGLGREKVAAGDLEEFKHGLIFQ